MTAQLIALTGYTALALAALPIIWRERASWRPEVGLLLLIGLSAGASNLALSAALMNGSVVRTMLLFFLLPLWGALGGRIFLGEAIGAGRILALSMTLVGSFVVVGGASVLDHPVSAQDGLALLAGVCFSATGIANRKARRIPSPARPSWRMSDAVCLLYQQPHLTRPRFPQWEPRYGYGCFSMFSSGGLAPH